MVKIPRRQILTEKMEPYNSTKGSGLKLAGQDLKLATQTVAHTVDRATPFATAVRGTPQDTPEANFIRDITGINNQFAMVDLEGNAKIQATKINADLQKKWADNPTCPEFQAEVNQAIGQVFDDNNADVPLSQQLNWQKTKQATLQAFKKANMEWAEKQSLSNLNRRVKKMNEEANNRANFYGENDSLDEFMSDNATARNLLSGMADDFGMSKEQKAEMLSAFDTQQMFNYLKGLAKTNPDKAEAIVNNNDALAIMLGTSGRKDLASAVKTARTKKNKETLAELGMPSNWGDVTKRATMAYADRLESQGIERADAIKEAIRRMKEQETNLTNELRSGNTSDERKKEIMAQLETFTTEGPQEVDYGGFTDEDWEKLSAQEQQETLKRDLEKHIRKGRELQKTRASDLAKAQMYEEFNAFTSNPSEATIAERKASPEYYLDNNYKKVTDAMEKWYKTNLKPSNVEQTANVDDIFDSLSLLARMKEGDTTLPDLFAAYYQDLAKIQSSGKFTQEDIDNYAMAAREVINDKTFAKNYDYLVNKARDYFPVKTGRFWTTGSGLTAKALEDKFKRVQAEAFAFATYQMLQDGGDITNAIASYVGAQDELYKQMLLRAGIDLDVLEEKRANNERAIFILNGIPQEYLGRDDNGVILSQDAWDTIQVPQAVKSNAERDEASRAYDKARKRNLNPQATGIMRDIIQERYPGAIKDEV